MIRLGVLCAAEIASRRFMPALLKVEGIKYVGVAVSRSKIKAQNFILEYGGVLFSDFDSMISSPEIDAVYIPLPPSMHFEWAKKALEAGKNVLVEKPFTTAFEDAAQLLAIAEKNGLAVHENYMFQFHSQIDALNSIVSSREIGDTRLFRICFGFPFRSANDFRYDKSMGGGALLDCGGYTLKYASMLLGESTRVICAKSNFTDGYDVDMYGSATLVNDDGVTAQVAFGMDQNYKCEIEIWGSKGTVYTNRILTAPPDYVPSIVIRKGNEEEIRELPLDDAFMKSILYFQQCVENGTVRKESYSAIACQSNLVREFKELAGI